MQLSVNPNQTISSKIMKKVFIGIDFSKSKFDAVMILGKDKSNSHHHEFSNGQTGFENLLDWISGLTDCPKEQWLVCGEHTGLYSLALSKFLNDSGITIWLESGLQIKQSAGISRSKNDKTDAFKIAMYAVRFADKARNFIVRSSVLDQITDLTAYLERLVKAKSSLSVPVKELIKVKSNQSVDIISEGTCSFIESIDNELERIEKHIMCLLKSEELLFENYELLCSINGIGFKNAVMILILTDNFTKFEDPRKFGCYCGVVPFEQSSGTSFKTKPRVNKIANKKMKSLLTLAALSAIRNNTNIKEYYLKKQREGKPNMLIVNNVRNRLIHLMFAVVRTKKPYDMNYKSAA